MGKQGTEVPVAADRHAEPANNGLPRYNPRHSRASAALPGRLLGAMDRQSGLTMQASQSFPQQLVRLVGHRHKGDAAVRSRTNAAQMGGFESDTPIG